MNCCEQYIDLISADIDGELPADEKQELIKHMEACESCRELYAYLSCMSQAVSDTEVDPPETLLPGLLNRLDMTKQKKSFFSLIGARPFTVAAAVILIVVITMAGGKSAFEAMFYNSSDDAAMEGEYGAVGKGDSDATLQAAYEQPADTIADDKQNYDESEASLDVMTAAPESADNVTPETAAPVASTAAPAATATVRGTTENVTRHSSQTTRAATSQTTAAAAADTVAGASAPEETDTQKVAENINRGLYPVPAVYTDEAFAFRMVLWADNAPRALHEFVFVPGEPYTYIYRIPASLIGELLQSEVYAGETVFETTEAGLVDPQAKEGLVILILKRPEQTEP